MLSKVRSITRSFSIPTWSIPIALLVITVVSYGLRARTLGFFWDDWPYLWFFHRFGPQGILNAFDQDRPFLSAIYVLSLSLFGDSSQAWQAFALFARWLCATAFWWALAMAWPRQREKTAWAALLFLVYPGFTQQWIALIYGQAFFLYAAVFFSIGVTLWLARHAGRLSRAGLAAGTLLALALSAFTMFSTEYFFGLELLRPILLWLVLASTPEQPAGWSAWRGRLLRVLKWWVPYLVLMVAFVIWRGFIHIFPGKELTALESIQTSPLPGLQNLLLTMLEDLIEAGVVAWGQPLQLSSFIENGPAAGLRLLALIIITGVAVTAYLAALRPAEETSPAPQRSAWGLQAMAVGALALLAAGWPFWVTGLSMRMGFPLDRYSLPLAPGVCLLLAGAIDWLGRTAGGKAALLGLIVAFSSGFHFNNALLYRQDWNEARSFFWQLTWRAPALQPGTLILTESLPFRYYEDDSLAAPLNWTYDPQGSSQEMLYMLYDIQVRKQSLTSFEPGTPLVKDYRAAQFTGSTSQIVLLAYAPPGCVRVLDPQYDRADYRLPVRLQKVLQISDPRHLIQDSVMAAAPPSKIFGEEPKHRWCYYFQKAELARQQEDWQTVITLGRTALKQGYRPEDPVEYLTIVEGMGQAGYFEDAFQLTGTALKGPPIVKPAVCSVWGRIRDTHPEQTERFRDWLQDAADCTFP